MEVEGAFVPPMMEKRRFIFFAIDNTDFSEDTPDGKGTLHGTVTAIYQRKSENSKQPTMDLNLKSASDRSLKALPEVELVPCHVPFNSKPDSKDFPEYQVGCESEEISDSQAKDTAWLIFHANHISSSVSKENNDVSNEEEEIVPVKQVNIPTLSAFNSLTCTALPLTVVGTPPLLAEPAHEWQTLFNCIKTGAAHQCCYSRSKP